MRGEELKEIRRQNLVLLRNRMTLERLAEKTGTNATYLSQIANKNIQKGGKRPRSLSDEYAEKIEKGMGLEPGWMDHDHSSETTTTAAPGGTERADLAHVDLEQLMSAASPRSKGALEQIAEAASTGHLTDADVELLRQIAERIARKD